MFTAGLLHDVGRMLFAERLGDRYTEVIDTADKLGLPLETVESRLLLINHADLTDRLLRQWNFSPELINPIALHHLSVGNIRRMVPRMVEQVSTLALANRLAHALLLGSSGNDAVYPIEEFVQALNLSADVIREICRTVPDETLDLRIAMLSHSAAARDASSCLDTARAALGARRRLFAGHPPALRRDGPRVRCRRHPLSPSLRCAMPRQAQHRDRPRQPIAQSRRDDDAPA